jgi:myo-inositol-hexaphosphate 3-phosphohydrolase
MIKKKIIKISALILLLMTILLTIIGCDGAIKIKGRAYEWINAPEGAQGMIFISEADLRIDRIEADPSLGIEPTLQRLVESVPEDITVVPLEDVKIIVESEKVGELTTTSNGSGDFEYWRVTAAGRYQITITASKDGYIDVIGKTEHELVFAHVIVVILVKNKNAD